MDTNTVDDVANAMGICLVLNNSHSVDTTELEVMDDIEGEQETCGELLDDDNDDGDVGTAADTKEVLANIQAASKGVKEGTAAAYDRLVQLLLVSQCLDLSAFLPVSWHNSMPFLLRRRSFHKVQTYSWSVSSIPRLTITLLASLCKGMFVLQVCMLSN